MISSSKSEYGRNNALWDTGFRECTSKPPLPVIFGSIVTEVGCLNLADVIGLSQGGPAALKLAQAQVMEYVHEAKWVGHLPGGMAASGGGGVQW